MGKTNPRLRKLMEDLLDELRPFHRALRKGRGKEAFEDVQIHVFNYMDALQMLNHPDRQWGFVLAVVTAQQREINEHRAEVEKLREEVSADSSDADG